MLNLLPPAAHVVLCASLVPLLLWSVGKNRCSIAKVAGATLAVCSAVTLGFLYGFYFSWLIGP